MNKLSIKEIKNIGRLLLSVEDSSVQLALELLQQHQYAIKDLQKEIEIYLGFYPDSLLLLEWTTQVFPDFSIQKNPPYIFYCALNESLSFMPDLVADFMRQEEEYEPYIAYSSKYSMRYLELANYFGTELKQPKMKAYFLQKAIKYNPYSANLHFAIAYHWDHDSNISNYTSYQDKIIKGYELAFELEANFEPLYALALFLESKVNQKEKAIECYKKGLKLFPNREDFPLAYARILLEKKEYTAAKKYALLAEDIVINYNRPIIIERIYNVLGLIYWQGFAKREKAETYFAEAMECNPYYTKPLHNAIKMWLEVNNYTQLIAWKFKILDSNPNNIMLLVEIAQLYTKIKKWDKAKIYYQKALDIHPNYHIALDGLAAIQS